MLGSMGFVVNLLPGLTESIPRDTKKQLNGPENEVSDGDGPCHNTHLIMAVRNGVVRTI